MARQDRRNALTGKDLPPDYPDTYQEDAMYTIGHTPPEYRPVGGRGFEPTGMYGYDYYKKGSRVPELAHERGLDQMDDAELAARGFERRGKHRGALDMRPDTPPNPNDPRQSDPFGGTEDDPGRAFDELTPEEQRMLLNRGRSVWEPRTHYPEKYDEDTPEEFRDSYQNAPAWKPRR